MGDLDLEPHEYRRKGERRPPKVKYTFFELLSFSIGSTLATRKKAPADPDKVGRMMQAGFLGWIWYLTHHGP